MRTRWWILIIVSIFVVLAIAAGLFYYLCYNMDICWSSGTTGTTGGTGGTGLTSITQNTQCPFGKFASNGVCVSGLTCSTNSNCGNSSPSDGFTQTCVNSVCQYQRCAGQKNSSGVSNCGASEVCTISGMVNAGIDPLGYCVPNTGICIIDGDCFGTSSANPTSWTCNAGHCQQCASSINCEILDPAKNASYPTKVYGACVDNICTNSTNLCSGSSNVCGSSFVCAAPGVCCDKTLDTTTCGISCTTSSQCGATGVQSCPYCVNSVCSCMEGGLGPYNVSGNELSNTPEDAIACAGHPFTSGFSGPTGEFCINTNFACVVNFGQSGIAGLGCTAAAPYCTWTGVSSALLNKCSTNMTGSFCGAAYGNGCTATGLTSQYCINGYCQVKPGVLGDHCERTFTLQCGTGLTCNSLSTCAVPV
jgi:hypothetical protein